MPMKDLGRVKLHLGEPKRMSLGSGEYCIITATSWTNHFVRVNLQYEDRGTPCDRMKRAIHSGQKQILFRPDTVPIGWRLCTGPFGDGWMLAIHPIILP
jgi:hypothetical protein